MNAQMDAVLAPASERRRFDDTAPEGPAPVREVPSGYAAGKPLNRILILSVSAGAGHGRAAQAIRAAAMVRTRPAIWTT